MRLCVAGVILISLISNSSAQEVDSIKYYQLLNDLRTTSSVEEKLISYRTLGDHHYEVNEYDKAQAYYDSCLSLIPKSSQMRLEILKNQSYALLALGEHNGSQKLLNELIPALVKTQDSVYLCKCYNRKAYNFIKLSKSDSSVQYYLKSLQCFENIGDQVSVIQDFSNLSNVLYRMEEDEKALFYLQKAHRLAVALGDTAVMTTTSSNLAIRHTYLSQLDTAWKYANMSLSFAKDLNLERSISLAYLRMALITLKKGEYDRAISYADATMSWKELDGSGVITARKYKAEAYLKLNRFDSALSNINQSIALASEGNDIEEIFILYQIASNIHEEMGSLTKALDHYKRYSILKDSALNMEKLSKIESLMTQYDTEKKDHEIVNLTHINEIQNLRNSRYQVIGFSILVILVLIGLTIALYYQKKLFIQKEQAANYKQQLLRSQLNPHFIFNALTSIRGFLFENPDLKGAVTYLGQFAKLMRMVLDHSSREWVTLHDEVEALKIYMNIQQMRFNHGFNYTIKIDPAISPEKIRVPPLLAQPFIENAIEHGFKNITYQGQIDFCCQSEAGIIRCSIVDNGIGIAHVPNQKEHESRALSIFKQRIEMLGRQLKTEFSFIINDLKETGKTGTKVEYTLPTELPYA